jgi:hypothetical protein
MKAPNRNPLTNIFSKAAQEPAGRDMQIYLGTPVVRIG